MKIRNSIKKQFKANLKKVARSVRRGDSVPHSLLPTPHRQFNGKDEKLRITFIHIYSEAISSASGNGEYGGTARGAGGRRKSLWKCVVSLAHHRQCQTLCSAIGSRQSQAAQSKFNNGRFGSPFALALLVWPPPLLLLFALINFFLINFRSLHSLFVASSARPGPFK